MEWETLEEKVKEKFINAELVEKFADRRMYSIPQSSVSSLAVAFQALEDCKILFLDKQDHELINLAFQ